MDKFKTIYRILSALEKSMDVEDPDWSYISAERHKRCYAGRVSDN